MRYPSPLRKHHAAYPQPRHPDREAVAHRPGAAQGARPQAPEVEYIPFGPSAGDGPQIVAGYGDLESEYAAIRKGAGLFDAAHRGTILVTGDDRRSFLDSMVTQALDGMDAGTVRETFWLNRKGRIDADLLLIELGDRVLIDVDVHAVVPTAAALADFVFTEDVAITDVTPQFHHIAVHGPQAAAVVGVAAGTELNLDDLTARTIHIEGVEVVTARRDQLSEPGLELITSTEGTVRVWEALLGADEAIGGGRRRVRRFRECRPRRGDRLRHAGDRE